MKCTHCQAQNDDNAVFCMNCGKKLEKPAPELIEAGDDGTGSSPSGPVCPVCGKENTADSGFCAYCGAKLVGQKSENKPVSSKKEEPEPATETPVAPPMPPVIEEPEPPLKETQDSEDTDDTDSTDRNGNRKKIIFACLAVAVVAVVAVVAFMLGSGTGADSGQSAGVDSEVIEPADPDPEPVMEEENPFVSTLESGDPTVLLKVNPDAMKADSVPEEISIVESGLIQTWKLWDLDDAQKKEFSLRALAGMSPEAVRTLAEKYNYPCTFEINGVYNSAGQTLALYINGETQTVLTDRAVNAAVNGVTFSGFMDQSGAYALVTQTESGEPFTLGFSTDRAPWFLRDPDREAMNEARKDWFITEACEDAVIGKAETPADDNLRGFEPGKYKAGYIMKVRENPSLTAKQVGRVEKDQIVNITDLVCQEADNSIWGKIDSRSNNWICIQDNEYDYLIKQ